MRSRLSLVLYLGVACAAFSGCSDETAEPSGDPDASDATTSDAATSDADATVATDTVDVDTAVEPPGVPVNLGAPDVDLQTVAGLQVHELTYTVPGLDIERTLEVRLWYATDDATGTPALFEPDVPLFSDEFAWADATVLPPPGDTQAPLVLYSHGGRGFAGQISTVARQFVRNGWIVVAPSHPGQNLFDFQETLPFSFPAIRAFDTLAALDWVENLPAEHPLAGRINTERILAMGHSYGGQNSWLLAGLPLDIEGITARCTDGCTPADIAAFEAFRPEPRVVAGVSLDNLIDPNLFLDASFAEFSTPMLHISGTEGNDGADIFRRAAAANLTWISLIGGCHESTTGTIPCDTLDLMVSLHATGTYTVAFATRHVLGSTDPAVLSILDGSTPVSASVALERSAGVP